MQEILALGQAYSDWIIMAIQFFTLIMLAILSHKITVLRKQMKRITNRVEDYLTSIFEEEEKNYQKTQENRRKKQKEAQNQLISSVLEEIFP